ncbi:MAG TPA: response regulator [Ktedonobacterales bacterium]|nr:response regulator [Ktedonobacterales bacterium]
MAARARVLIVDDDDAIRETVRFALEDVGYEVDEAPDGLAALRTLRTSSKPSVVLLDLMMPGLDGAGVLGAVAADHQLSSRHAFVLVTASSKTLTLAFANLLSSLAVRTLAKPFDVDQLLHVVDEAGKRLSRTA